MAFKPGHKKLGGRKAGTPNKKTLSLIEKCEARGLDVFDGMLELAQQAEGFDRFRMLVEIAQYILPKRKAIEVSSEVDLTIVRQVKEVEDMPREEQIKLLESELKRLKE